MIAKDEDARFWHKANISRYSSAFRGKTDVLKKALSHLLLICSGSSREYHGGRARHSNHRHHDLPREARQSTIRWPSQPTYANNKHQLCEHCEPSTNRRADVFDAQQA